MDVQKDYRSVQKLGFFNMISMTSMLIAINILLFFVFSILTFFNPSIVSFIAVSPLSVVQLKTPFTIFTSMFMHAGFFHLLVNMFSLFFLGSLTEKIIGRKRFFWFYLIAGVVGSLFFIGFAYLGQSIQHGSSLFGSINDSAVGASGAIFGLLGILATLLPHKEIYLIMGPLIVIILQFIIGGISSIPTGISNALDIIGTVIIFVMIFSMMSPSQKMRKFALPLRLKFWLAPVIAIVPLFIIGYFVSLPIGNTAHLGGLVAGLTYGYYLRKKYAKKVLLLNRIVQ